MSYTSVKEIPIKTATNNAKTFITFIMRNQLSFNRSRNTSRRLPRLHIPDSTRGINTRCPDNRWIHFLQNKTLKTSPKFKPPTHIPIKTGQRRAEIRVLIVIQQEVEFDFVVRNLPEAEKVAGRGEHVREHGTRIRNPLNLGRGIRVIAGCERNEAAFVFV